MEALSPSISGLLACPMCSGRLAVNAEHMHCATCGTDYPVVDGGQLDLRLRGAREYHVDFHIEGDPTSASAPNLDPVSTNPHAEIDWRSITLSADLQHGNRPRRRC